MAMISRFPPALAVTVIVPVYKGGHDFRLCLEGISGLSPAAGEIIVVIDGEDNGEGLVAEVAGVTLIRLPVRSGPAAARNAGARAAGGDLLVFLDADTVPTSDLIARIRHNFDDDPGLSALIGSYDDAPGADNFLSQYRNLLHHYTHQTASPVAYTFWGACGAIRREAFFSVGGFDEAYEIPAMEDVELGYRLTQAGYRIRLDRDLQVKHLKCWEMLNMLRTDILQRAIPWTQLLLRKGKIDNDLNLRVDSRLSAVLCWILFSLVVLAPLWPDCIALIGVVVLSLLWLNAGLYRFFLQKRGWLFALRSLPWHWLYFLYGSAAFAYVLISQSHKHMTLPRLLE